MHNVLVIGSGGREHALCLGLRQDPAVSLVFAAPGNPGMAQVATCVPIPWQDGAALIAFCRERQISRVVVGPEAPLAAGLVDRMEASGVAECFGPTVGAARLESSKGFAKDLSRRYGIPTARYERAFSFEQARSCPLIDVLPVVVKEDGLCAGKGVHIVRNREVLHEVLVQLFEKPRVSESGVVIEEFLSGQEVSFFVLCRGDRIVPMGFWHDYKRAREGNTGPNTGGMGAYGPSPFVTREMESAILDGIVAPTLRAMLEVGTPFSGLLYVGLMLTNQGPRLIEYNARFGDPETQALVPCLNIGLSNLFWPNPSAAADVNGKETIWKPGSRSVTVVMTNRGYPSALEMPNQPITGLDVAAGMDGVHVFHSGTAVRDGQIVASGGRVLSVTGVGASFAEARSRAYAAVSHIHWTGCSYRKDIADGVLP